jgi:hypothetical protein
MARLARTRLPSLMEYKHWIVKHGVVIPEDERLRSECKDENMTDNTEDKYLDDDEKDEVDKSVADWLKAWSKREAVSKKLKRISK